LPRSAAEEASALEVDNLTRVYERRRREPRVALDRISFDAPPGSILGLLGPNGAGKTTCVKVVTGMLAPTSGTVRVGGVDVVAEQQRAQYLVGVSFGGENGLYTRLSARDNLRFFGTMFGLSGRPLRDRIAEVLELVDLVDRTSDRVETFSRGMKQRLHIARALLHSPAVLVLDEPSAGLDPASARMVRDLVSVLVADGRTVLLTTHDLVEAEELCTEVVILDSGRIVRRDSPSQLRAEAAARLGMCLELELSTEIEPGFLQMLPGYIRDRRRQDAQQIWTSDPSAASACILDHLGDAVISLTVLRPSLEDVYFDAIGVAL
jgi:ABC-2 type transport system ATP-binding protein